MANKKKLYTIHKLDFDILFKCGKIEDGILVCNQYISEHSEKFVGKNIQADKKGDCQLFNQTKKALNIKEDNESIFEDVFVNIDFSQFIKTDSLQTSLKKMPNGIKLFINGKEIHIVTFLKSNSMSKNCCVYFINKEYKDLIEPRMTFNLNKGKMILSKWFAYSGLAISDSTVLEGFNLNKNEIVIVPDSYSKRRIECITAVSIPLLRDKFNDISKVIEDIYKLDVEDSCTINDSKFKESEKYIFYSKKIELDNIEAEINSYYESRDFIRIKKENIKESNLKIKNNREKMIYIIEKLYKFTQYTFKQIEDLILSLNEYESSTRDINDEKEVYWEKFHVNNYPVTVNKFDGEGLIDKEYARDINLALNGVQCTFENDEIDELCESIFGEEQEEIPYKKGYSFQIRLPFIKGVVHACDFKSFFKEKGVEYIYGKTYSLNGTKLRKYKIDEVKLILTESQFKAGSFMSNIELEENETPLEAYFRKLKKYDYSLAISNLEPKHDNYVNLNYQFVATIPFSKRDLNNLLEENKQRFVYYFSNNKIGEEIASSSIETKKIYDANKEFFLNTKIFKNKRDKLFNSKRLDLLKVKLGCSGYRKLICSDLVELLYHSAYHHNGKKYNDKYKGHLKKYEFYAPNTEIPSTSEAEVEQCILLRNPHYSRNEIAVLKPMKEKEDSERIKYFGHLTGVIMFNPLSLSAERLGGADYDGDTLLLLTNRYRSNTIRKLLDKDGKTRYPLIKIPSVQSGKVQYSYNSIVESLENTFSSRVGLISDAAQHKGFNVYNNGNNDEEEIMPFYTILSGLEIDSAKSGVKPYLFNTNKEKEVTKFLDLNRKLKGKWDKEPSYKEYKNSVEKLNGDSNLFNVCRNVIELNHKEKAPDWKKPRISGENNIKEKERAISIYLVYEEIFGMRKKYRKGNFANNSKKQKEVLKSIRDNLLYILNGDEEVASMEVYEKFRTEDPIGTFVKYCKHQEKYHYILTEEERVEFIYNELGINYLPIELEQVVTRFENNGCYLLYLLLYYWAEIERNENNHWKEKIVENIPFKKEDVADFISNYINAPIGVDVNEVLRISTIMKNDIIDVSTGKMMKIEGNISKYFDLLEEETKKYLSSEASTLSPNSCISIIKFNNLKESHIVFDVFVDQLVEIFNREEI